ncbi:hypothetical protein [Actinophytocola algeriensis]|uniref:Uncharacterized protein n=1 Tax=Actinophytocola algeriensis TaxID=1768010 RepID=A0A7W7Q5D6_9PSEU|nr:hypothetical protein [Actinophytocola algeriensis]MBB4907371.1 hypothetical protein [Actinophytocola algeriensis]MBE1478854.1 hypothetical protein [Actinophytocola algeriensis]
MSLIIEYFGVLSSEIHACEVAATFHGYPEFLEQRIPPDVLPSLDELEQRKEVVLETARAMEKSVDGLLGTKATFETEIAAIKGELSASGGVPETSVLDREVLRTELRKRLGLVNESTPPGDDPVPADGDDSEG